MVATLQTAEEECYNGDTHLQMVKTTQWRERAQQGLPSPLRLGGLSQGQSQKQEELRWQPPRAFPSPLWLGKERRHRPLSRHQNS